MYTFQTSGKTISIFSCAGSECPIIYLNTFSNEGQKVFEAAQSAGCPPFTLVVISDLDWNHDMVPWESPPAFKNADPCTGGADDYLQLLTEELSQRQRRKLLESLAGVGLLATLWPGCMHCTAFTRRMYFPVWVACLDLSGIPE